MTQSGMIAGTPLYMAPEQALGQKLDQRADLFSFGSVLYQMLTGRPPFRAANTLAVLKRVTEDTPRPIQEVIPEIPAWMCEIVTRLHAKDPNDRYASAREVSEVLEHCRLELQERRLPDVVAFTASTIHPVASQSAGESIKPARSPLAKLAAAALILMIGLVITEMTGVTNLASTSTPEPDGLVAETNDTDVTPRPVSVDQPSGTKPSLIPAPSPWPDNRPPLAKSPMDADQAKKHQQDWADYLGLPVEKEMLLGQNEDGKDVTLTMVLIPPGEFMMGTNAVEREMEKGDTRRELRCETHRAASGKSAVFCADHQAVLAQQAGIQYRTVSPVCGKHWLQNRRGDEWKRGIPVSKRPRLSGPGSELA